MDFDDTDVPDFIPEFEINEESKEEWEFIGGQAEKPPDHVALAKLIHKVCDKMDAVCEEVVDGERPEAIKHIPRHVLLWHLRVNAGARAVSCSHFPLEMMMDVIRANRVLYGMIVAARIVKKEQESPDGNCPDNLGNHEFADMVREMARELRRKFAAETPGEFLWDLPEDEGNMEKEPKPKKDEQALKAERVQKLKDAIDGGHLFTADRWKQEWFGAECPGLRADLGTDRVNKMIAWEREKFPKGRKR